MDYFQPKLSVVVPVYNTEEYLPKLLDSLERQMLCGYVVEFIFVLNLCTDNSEQVIRNSKLENLYILKCDRRGCGLARNVGMEFAKGKYLWFMDSDDWLIDELAIAHVIGVMEEGNMPILRIPYESKFGSWFSMVWQYCFQREYINEFRFRQEQPSEDDAFMKKVFEKYGINEKRFLDLPCVTKALYHYEVGRPGSNMTRYNNGEDINV